MSATPKPRRRDRLRGWLVQGEQALTASLRNDRVWACCVALTIMFQLVLIFNHRPWLDEWQALLIAQESPTITELMANLHYEGHPPLWYLTLRAVALVVPIYWVLPVTCAIAALPTQATILLRMPFTRLQRLLVATGYFMLFDYLTISRSLTLGVTSLILFMAMRDRRIAWLWLVILPLCDFMFGVLSIILVIVQWRDRRLWAPGIVLWMIASATAAWSVIPAPDMLPAIKSEHWFWSYSEFFERLSVLLIPIQFVRGRFMWNGTWPLGLGHIGGILFLVFAWNQIASDRFHRVLLTGFLLLTFAFSILVYPLHTRHLSLIALLLILLKWREADRGEGLSPPFRLWLMVSSLCGIAIGFYSFAVPFNTGHLAARAIVERGLANKQWLVLDESPGPGLHALTGMDFREVQSACSQSFIRWNHDVTIKTVKEFETYLRAEVRRQGRLYLLTNFALPLPPSLVRIITYIPSGYDGQRYYINMVGPDAPERDIRAPRCVPHQRALDQATIW
ncbi:hypothetical protein ACWGK7_19075 (plasmid) [Sphingomonas aurantiaca]